MKASTSSSASSMQRGELGQFGAQLVGDLAPLLARGLGVVLGEGGGDESGDDAAAALAGMGQGVAHEVHAAALPGGAQHFGDGRLDALVGVGDHQLDAAQAAPRELAQELGPEGLGLRRADIHAEHFAPPVAVDADGDDHRRPRRCGRSRAPSRRWRRSTDRANRPRSGGRGRLSPCSSISSHSRLTWLLETPSCPSP